MSIALFGELLIDFISKDSVDNLINASTFTKNVGGSPANITRNLIQLGINAYLVSRIGNDQFGRFILKKLRENNVNASYIQIDEVLPTTVVFVSKTSQTPDFLPIRGADTNLQIPDEKLFENISWIHVSCWPLTKKESCDTILKILRKASETSIKIGFDPNCRKKLFCDKKIDLEPIIEIFKKSFVTKPSLDDMKEIFGPMPDERYIEILHSLGLKYVILTLGKDGALVSDGKTLRHIPSAATKVVDATGAGDAFWSGIYYGLLNGWNIFDSSKLGSVIAAHVLENVGSDVKLQSIDYYISKMRSVYCET
ncbi:carbohydrate kinase [Thermosipho ferrireducens]|uniref:Carbohydrate kinase n=1 Tax=Thermosipho ferrireducens TaxID=2571116 RepID=A0ABX7S8I0_9BACT|nr:carbohydrate kinase [Thermosipho ferrireducens]QTA38095.1 carbohydrate kinase [Thermosipho ferrireducens]